MKIAIAIADNDELFVRSLSAVINGFKKFEVIFIASNEKDLPEILLAQNIQPHILLAGTNLENSAGIVKRIKKDYPWVKMSALCEREDEFTIIRMIRAGCSGFIYKDFTGKILENALIKINQTGYFNPDIKYILMIFGYSLPTFSQREAEILKLLCSDLSYRQIATETSLPEQLIKMEYDELCIKLNVKTRPGMVLEAIRLELVCLDD